MHITLLGSGLENGKVITKRASFIFPTLPSRREAPGSGVTDTCLLDLFTVHGRALEPLTVDVAPGPPEGGGAAPRGMRAVSVAVHRGRRGTRGRERGRET